MTIVSFEKATAAAAAALLLLAGCSDPQGTEPGDAAGTPRESSTPTPESSGDSGARSGGHTGGKSAGGSSEKATRGGSGGGRPGVPGSGGGGGGGGGFAAGRRGSASYPAAGDYVYAQDGWERFCQASCNKEPLPKTATTTASYSERSADGAVVVTETTSSEQQKLTTTTRFTPQKALITKVVVEFAYRGFDFSQSYEPQPPIESLLFPLSAHDAWRGRWKARTSGDYRVRVAGREPVDVGGRSVSAYRLETVTNFRGDFSGRAQMSVWIDPDTAMVVKTDGQIAVASNFGEYTSDFRTTLRSGPGY